MRVIALFVLLLAAAQAASVANKKTEFTCIAGAADISNSSQVIRIECGAAIEQGSSGIAEIDWSSILRDTTRLQDTRMLVDSVPETLGEGEELISVHGTFTHDDKALPTCQTKRKIVVEVNKTSEIEFTPKKYDPTDDNFSDKHKGDKKAKKDKKEETQSGDEDYSSSSGSSAPEKEEKHKDKKVKKDKKEKKEKETDSKTPESGEEKTEEKTDSDEKEYEKYSKRKDRKSKKDKSKIHKAEAHLMDAVFDEWDSMEVEDVDAELAAWAERTKQCPKKGDDGTDYKDDKEEYPEKKKETKKAPKKEESYEEEGSGEEEYSSKASLSAATPQNKNVRPNGMRVLVKCKSAEDLPEGVERAEGTCSVRLRFTLRMTGLVNQFPEGNPSTEMDALVTADQFTCRTRTFFDEIGVLSTLELNGDDGRTVDTEVCFPRAITQEQGTPNQATIPAGAAWTDVTLARAVRFSRYASTLHGCLPGQEYAPGQSRTWADVARWGGAPPPDVTPSCRSCFKDGINYGAGLGGIPRGWETRDAILSGSYQDAAVVTTDFDADVPAAPPSVVVAFRATVTSLNSLQWVSNLGSCGLLASFRDPIRNSAGVASAAAGTACSGWASQVDLLYRDISADVIQRVNALPSGARIFITGHSRGGALAAYFAARLLLDQDAGLLGTYTGPFGRRGQISLYTFGAPRVGDATFAGFLEQRMYERFRIINRFDPVTSAPGEIQGYQHFRPAVWFREAGAFGGVVPLESASLRFQYCVLTPAAQLSFSLGLCFDSCRSAVVCTNQDVPPAVAVAGTRVPVNAACASILDSTTEGTQTQLFRAPLGFIQDHSTYMGINVDNANCLVDQSVLQLGRESSLPWCALVPAA